MPGYALRFRLLPLAAMLSVGSCLSTEGYYRYQDAGASGTAGTTGSAGASGNAGTTGGGAGTIGSAGSTGGGPVGTAGTTAAGGRGGTTGSAGTTAAGGRGGTTGSAGRGGSVGTTGTGGTIATGGASGVLFSDDFEGTLSKWDFGVATPPPVISDGTKVLNMAETAGDQRLAAAGMASWTNLSIEARVKVLAFTGTSSSDVVALCARLTDATHFYYFAIQATDMKAKIKINNDGNSSLGSSIDIGFAVDTWFRLRMDVVGNTITVFVQDTSNNWVMKGTYTASASDQILPMGGIGLMVQRTNAEFDDVIVRALP